jgi:LPS export ABC transporter protein LptC
MLPKQSFLSIFCLFLWILAGCGSKQEVRNVSQTQTPRSESQLSLSGTTIEESDENGQIIWKIRAKRLDYSPDRKIAKLEDLTGDLFEKGKVVLQVSAAKGEVERGAEEIILKEKVIAIDTRNRTTIKSELAQWYPQKNLLVIPEKLTGDRPDLVISAQTGTYETKIQKLNLKGNVIANHKNPQLQLKTEELAWEIPQQQINSDRPLEIWRYQGKAIVDRLVGDRATISLKDTLATIENNVVLKSLKPNLEITTDVLAWNYTTRLVIANKTVQIDDRTKDITLMGERGQVDLERAIATLRNGTQAVDRRQSSKLYANDLVWYFDKNTLEAFGDIKYQQERPKLTLAGDRAVGNLKNNQIIVTSKQGKQVETKIIPE